MTSTSNANLAATGDDTSDRFATLHFQREVAAPISALWQVWTAPAARAIWSAPTPEVTVDFIEADTRVGGREVSICRVAGQPDIRCECGWLDLQPGARSVNYETVSMAGVPQSAALITADFTGDGDRSRIAVTVQLSALAADMGAGYRAGFEAGLDNMAHAARRTMVIERVIRAPRSALWAAWVNPRTLPQWWGPEGYSCRTARIDLKSGGEWLFDMIGPDGTVYPNHHLYPEILPEQRIAYQLLAGENGTRHADAWVLFEEQGDATRITLGMVFSSEAEYQGAKGFGAAELGQQTLGKLEKFVAFR